MANVMISDRHLENIAQAIRYKNGTNKTYKPREMAAAIRGISTSSTVIDASLKDYIEKDLAGSLTVDCDYVGKYAFAYMNDITAFSSNTATSVKENAFYMDDQLYSVNLPNVSNVEKYAFSNCKNLNEIYMPNVSTILLNGFTNIGAETLEFPVLENLNTLAISDCPNLTKVDLGSNLRWVYYQSIYDCDNLTAIIIRKNSVPKLCDNGGPFPTHFRKDYTGDLEPGYIYVPAAMVESYRNFKYTYDSYGYDYWNKYNYRAIESYPDICG